jgi:hypothetical protein
MSDLETIFNMNFLEVAEQMGLSNDIIQEIERDVREYYMLSGVVTVYDVAYAKLIGKAKDDTKYFFKKLKERVNIT